MSQDKLYLVVRDEPAGYGDGALGIGLFMANSHDQAIEKAMDKEGASIASRTQFSARAVDEGLIEIVRYPTDYEG